MPIASAQTPAAIDEERRLLYVALTRSEEELWCSWFERSGDDAGREAGRPRAQPVAGADRADHHRAREGGGADGGDGGLAPGGGAAPPAGRGHRGRRRRPVRPGKVGPPDRSEVGWRVACRNSWSSCARSSARATSSRATSVHADYTHDEALTTVPVVPLAARPAGIDRRGVRGPAAGERARRPGGRPGQRHRALRRRRAGGRRHPARLRPHEADSGDRHREPGRRGGAGRDARTAQRRARPAGPDLPGVARRAERLARRERRHQRRRHARRPLRRDAPSRARARGGAGRRHRPADRRQVRQVLERLRPDPAAHRLRGHAGHHDGGDGEAPAPVHRVVHGPGARSPPCRRWPTRCRTSCTAASTRPSSSTSTSW